MRVVFLSPVPYRVLRIFLGVMFLASGLAKSMDLVFSSKIIQAFAIIPGSLCFPAAVMIVLAEIVFGGGWFWISGFASAEYWFWCWDLWGLSAMPFIWGMISIAAVSDPEIRKLRHSGDCTPPFSGIWPCWWLQGIFFCGGIKQGIGPFLCRSIKKIKENKNESNATQIQFCTGVFNDILFMSAGPCLFGGQV